MFFILITPQITLATHAGRAEVKGWLPQEHLQQTDRSETAADQLSAVDSYSVDWYSLKGDMRAHHE